MDLVRAAQAGTNLASIPLGVPWLSAAVDLLVACTGEAGAAERRIMSKLDLLLGTDMSTGLDLLTEASRCDPGSDLWAAKLEQAAGHFRRARNQVEDAGALGYANLYLGVSLVCTRDLRNGSEYVGEAAKALRLHSQILCVGIAHREARMLPKRLRVGNLWGLAGFGLVPGMLFLYGRSTIRFVFRSRSSTSRPNLDLGDEVLQGIYDFPFGAFSPVAYADNCAEVRGAGGTYPAWSETYEVGARNPRRQLEEVARDLLAVLALEGALSHSEP